MRLPRFNLKTIYTQLSTKREAAREGRRLRMIALALRSRVERKSPDKKVGVVITAEISLKDFSKVPTDVDIDWLESIAWDWADNAWENALETVADEIAAMTGEESDAGYSARTDTYRSPVVEGLRDRLNLTISTEWCDAHEDIGHGRDPDSLILWVEIHLGEETRPMIEGNWAKLIDQFLAIFWSNMASGLDTYAEMEEHLVDNIPFVADAKLVSIR